MRFELPNAVAAMNNAVAKVGEDGDSWEIIGDPLSKAVDEVVPAYDEKLHLKLDPSPGAKRAEICTVRWGKIDKDIARLNGLVAAVRNVAAVIKSGKETIAHDWKGESYDAFRAQIEKVEKALDDYVTAVETTAAGLQSAVDGTRQLFTEYRDATLDRHLSLPGKFSPPEHWWRMSTADAERLAEHCTSFGYCYYDSDLFTDAIDRKLINKRLFDQVEKWDCTSNPEVVAGQYKYLIDGSYAERKHIRDKIHEWYLATDELKTRVGEALDAALENLRIIAEVKVFSALSVPGATAPGGAPGGDPGPGTGDPGPGAGYPGPGATSYPGPSGGDVAMPTPEPAPEPAPEPIAVDPVAAEPEPEEPEPADTAGTVSIKDGDRTISVSSPDGQGHVKLTVDDGSGTTKSYSLDFDAASGMGLQPGTEDQQPEEGVEQVPARSDGKCVIQDGDVTITAERPLFSPDSISVTVDDGTGSPTSYTLDFPEEPDATGTAEDTQPGTPGGASGAADTATRAPAAGPPAENAAAGQGTPEPDPAGAPDQAGQGGGADSAVDAGAADPAAQAGAPEPAGQRGASGQAPHVGAPDQAGQAGTPEPAVDAGAADPPAQAGASEPVAQRGASEPGAANPPAAGQTTSPQAWTSEQSGSLSGVLESDNVGEAGLASVPDAPAPESSDAMGMAGAGLPMTGGPNGAGGEPGRVGSGWSVHGDLFDSGEPVYSMHGVLGDDDLESREVQ